jgi:hypothetical protein
VRTCAASEPDDGFSKELTDPSALMGRLDGHLGELEAIA